MFELYRAGQNPGAVGGQIRDWVAGAAKAEPATTESAKTEAAAGLAAVPWEAEVLVAAGPELARQIIDSEGWQHLERRMAAIDEAGEDVGARLGRAVSERELDTAKDKSLALMWRLKTPASDSSAGRSASSAARIAATKGSPAPGTPSASTDRRRRSAMADRWRRADRGHQGGPEVADPGVR